jgi:type II secretory pathway pseudopilin PulG
MEDSPGLDCQSQPERKSALFSWEGTLVIMAILVVVGAIAIPNFIGAQQKAKAASIKGNFRTLQIAIESYATDSGGAYPGRFPDLADYLPGGSNTPHGSPGNPLLWPDTKDGRLEVANLSQHEWDLLLKGKPPAGLKKQAQLIYVQGKINVVGDSYILSRTDEHGSLKRNPDGTPLTVSGNL